MSASGAGELVKVLKYSSFIWAKARGNRWYHLGGGRGGESDSLLHFKTGFSPLRLPYETVRVVLRDKDYRDLVAERQPQVDAGDGSGYFPRYRDSMSDVPGCEDSGADLATLTARGPALRKVISVGSGSTRGPRRVDVSPHRGSQRLGQPAQRARAVDLPSGPAQPQPAQIPAVQA